MKPNISKLKQAEQQQAEQQHLQASSPGHEFGSVEEMLRFDASQVTPPETIVTRLQDSLAQNPPPKRPWWRRWFS